MINKLFRIIIFAFSIILLIYVGFPSPDFPNMPPNSVQSKEPGDMETPLRRGYYTNLTRAEVIAYYKQEFIKKNNLPTLRLNYPPEEAQMIIRDQTKSTFLEELAHPLRESLYINGFDSKDTIYEFKINEVIWQTKIIVKYVPSSIYIRILVTLLTIFSIFLLTKEYLNVRKN